MTAQYDDPFAQSEKTPAVSWKGVEIGTVVEGIVTDAPKLVQSRDYDTGEPAWWDKEETQPKMAVVVELDIDGDKYSLWAQKPSALFRALGDAQKASTQIQVGGKLAIKYTGEKANPDKPRLNPAKQFLAKFTPATPKVDDVFASVQAQGIDAAPPF